MDKYIFQIETSLVCDLKCPECAIGGGLIKRNKKLMSFDEYKIIADKIKPYARYVYLHIWGEPLLNPDIFKIIKYTATFAQSNISTNGMCMNKEMAEELILSGVTDVIVSIDGVSSEVYESYRVGGNVQKANDALRMINAANNRHGKRVNITPQFCVFKHNQHEMKAFEQICESLGLKASFKAPYISKSNSNFQLSDIIKYSRPHFADIASLHCAMTDCKSLSDVVYILVDGTVVACCYDYDGVTNFGNIYNQSLMEIRNSDKFKDFEDAIVTGAIPKFCTDNCLKWFLSGNCIDTNDINCMHDSTIQSSLSKLWNKIKIIK